MLKLHLFLKIPLKGNFRLGTRNIFCSFGDGEKSVSLSRPGWPPSTCFISTDIFRERVCGQNDCHIIDLYSYLELENLIISMGIFKKTIKWHPPSLHNVTITATFYRDRVCALTSVRH